MKKITFDNLENIILGADHFETVNDELNIFRFTKKQISMYQERDIDCYDKTFCAAGVKLYFRTDSTKLFLKLRVITERSTRKYFSADIWVNDAPIDYIDNFSGVELPEDYTQVPLPQGVVSKEISLGDGVKNVSVHLPRMAIVSIMEVAVDDNAFIEPIKANKTMLVFGDSITQGYDSLRPSNHYLAKLANKLNAEEINLAIGGEVIYPELAATNMDISPDYIIVGYGTNDWGRTKIDDFRERCIEFFGTLSKKYPLSSIFAITPIWRKNFADKKLLGSFFDVEKVITETASQYSNVKVISGWELVPHSEKYFADLELHPNDKGFEYYYKNIVEIVTKGI